jgi:hypothetical protein
MTSLPSHGRLNCSRCFQHGAKWGFSSIEQDGWVLENNPMSWGAADPRYLVLGFSKGTRQCRELLTSVHNAVPFAGFRHNVTSILRKLGLLPHDELIDSRINESEMDFAFGSLIRCSVSHIDSLSDRPSKSGDIINRLSRRVGGDDWAMNCMRQFLSQLSPRLRIVILLSNDDKYVDACFRRLSPLHTELKRINSIAYSDGRVTWVHTVHGSPLAQSHINTWLEGGDTIQGKKQREAIAAVAATLSNSDSVHHCAEFTFAKVRTETSVSPTTGIRRKMILRTGRGKPLPANPVRDAVRDALNEHPDLRPHTAQKEETKYIAAFLTSNCRTLALDKTSAGEQPIWIEARFLATDALPGIKRDFYPPSRGRNSNLHKLPGFKNGALVRLYPQTVSEAMDIVRLILGR